MFTRNSEINSAPEAKLPKWFLVVYRVGDGSTLNIHDQDINIYVLPACMSVCRTHTEAYIPLKYSTYTQGVNVQQFVITLAPLSSWILDFVQCEAHVSQ